MKKVSIIIPHFKTARWTAICIYHFKIHGVPIESEIILCDNSPGHPSIKAITETSLGDGVKVIAGDPEFPSHGHGYDLCYEQSDGDRIFTAETDSFPVRSGWFDEYVKASPGYDIIGPMMPQAAGYYIHPAGALYSRGILESVRNWQKAHSQWVFVPGAGAMLKTHPKECHVVAHEDWLKEFLITSEVSKQIDLWKKAGPFQEMRCFDEDTIENYGQRTRIENIEPVPGKLSYNKIGFEAGQFIYYFAKHNGIKCLECPTCITWMQGHEGRQAASTDLFGGGFRHIWCGTVSRVSASNLDADVVAFKNRQMESYFLRLPEDIRRKIKQVEEECHG